MLFCYDNELKIIVVTLCNSFNEGSVKMLVGILFNAYRLGKDSGKYTEELISPILSCLADSDSRVSSSLFNTRQITIGTELASYGL